MIDWSRFQDIVTPEEVNEAKAQFSPIDAGEYEVTLESIEPSESKQFLPMIKGKFKTTDNGRFIFYNQMLQNISRPDMTKVNIAEAVDFIGGLVGEEVVFKSIPDLKTVIINIPAGQKYRIRVSYGAKDVDRQFPKLKIVQKIEEVPFE